MAMNYASTIARPRRRARLWRAAFNINNMEQGLAIMEAAAAVDAPVIIQASRGARAYANDIMLAKMIEALIEIYPDIPVCMHQDHGNRKRPASAPSSMDFRRS